MAITCPHCGSSLVPRVETRGAQSRIKIAPVEMERLYREGLTLDAIGEKAGCTRERVRQLLKIRGVTRADGGQAIASAGKKEARESARLKNYEKRRGFTLQYRREMSEKL